MSERSPSGVNKGHVQAVQAIGTADSQHSGRRETHACTEYVRDVSLRWNVLLIKQARRADIRQLQS